MDSMVQYSNLVSKQSELDVVLQRGIGLEKDALPLNSDSHPQSIRVCPTP